MTVTVQFFKFFRFFDLSFNGFTPQRNVSQVLSGSVQRNQFRLSSSWPIDLVLVGVTVLGAIGGN